MQLPAQVTLRVGETYVLRLKGLGAAGYVWQYSLNGPGDMVSLSLEVAGPESGSDDAGAIIPGSSRDVQAKLQALRPGHVTIDFALRRPWELAKPPLQEHRLEVYVEGQ
jgi:predicted secreted protein